MVKEDTKTVIKGLISDIDESSNLTVVDKDDTDTINIHDILKEFVGSETTISIAKSEKKITV